MSDHGADVVIVGAGLVGLLLALLLSRRGRTVAIYDRWAGAFPLPRAAAIGHETVGTLHSAGVLEHLRPHLDQRPQSAPFRSPAGKT